MEKKYPNHIVFNRIAHLVVISHYDRGCYEKFTLEDEELEKAKKSFLLMLKENENNVEAL